MDTFNSVMKKLDEEEFEPRKNLFVLKQHYIPKQTFALEKDFSE